MKALVTTLLATALIAAPIASFAQARGGGHAGGGGFRAGSSFHGGSGFRGGSVGRIGSSYRGVSAYRGNVYRGGGYRGYTGYRGYGGYRGYNTYGWGLSAGLLAGAALSAPWYGGYGYYDDYYAPPVSYGYAAPAAPYACGQWIWNAPAYRYDWAPCAPAY